MKVQIKVCGMTRPEQVARLSEIGVNYAGFIFYPQSPRYVLQHMIMEEIRNVSSIRKVGVFVNTELTELLKMAEACRLDWIQLHGDETPDYCKQVSAFFPVLKAFRISNQERAEELVTPFKEVCEQFLFDTKGGEGYGGTGKKFDWELLSPISQVKPFFLSGGIGPGDAQPIGDFQKTPSGASLSAVDINSRFETAPGVKDLQSIETFIRKLNNSHSS